MRSLLFHQAENIFSEDNNVWEEEAAVRKSCEEKCKEEVGGTGMLIREAFENITSDPSFSELRSVAAAMR